MKGFKVANLCPGLSSFDEISLCDKQCFKQKVLRKTYLNIALKILSRSGIHVESYSLWRVAQI